MDLGEREHQLAAAALRRRPERSRPRAVVPLEALPGEAVRGVLVIEEVDQTVRRLRRLALVPILPGGAWCREMIAQAPDEGVDRRGLGGSRCDRGLAPLEDQL